VEPPVVERLPPALPPEERWWGNPWPAILTGLLALIVGGVIGYAVGDKGETSPERGGREAPVARTVTNTTTVPKVVVQTNTVTAPQTPSSANQGNEERRTEAETNLRKAERENQELKRQLEEAGSHP
jgi:hypothetical protein